MIFWGKAGSMITSTANKQIKHIIQLQKKARLRREENVFIAEGPRMVIETPEMMSRITKELYPGIARKFGTTSSKVERAIRHAIEVAWNRGRIDALDEAFGKNVCSLDDKPTNGEFIALVADRLSVERTA